jgi:hypothetical protein
VREQVQVVAADAPGTDLQADAVLVVVHGDSRIAMNPGRAVAALTTLPEPE